MTLKLVRVDDRLIHGQVVAVWLRAVGAHRIVIVDDRTARDEFLRDLVVLAAPQGVEVEVWGVDEGTSRVADLASSKDDVFVLMRSPVTALQLRKAGVPFDVLNVGGIGAGPGRRTRGVRGPGGLVRSVGRRPTMTTKTTAELRRCMGSARFGVRWKTTRCEATRPASWITCTPLAPVPITPTRRPARRSRGSATAR